jgi:trans-aconitate methyltransferase
MDLSARSTMPERMDIEPLDAATVDRCLRDLAHVNTLTLARRPTLSWLDRALRALPAGAPFTLVDAGSGNGDMLRAIARRHGARGTFIGVDRNPASRPSAEAATPADLPIRYVTADIFEWHPDPAPDFIISALFTHHLDQPTLARFLRWMQATARRGWFVNDLRRSRLAQLGFGTLARAAGWHEIVRQDGLTSIARAFRPEDWQALLHEAGVRGRVRARFPFRLCVESVP